MMTKKVKVTITGDRQRLSEGRQYGLGFAFCKKIKGGFETAHAPSTCKDYLNDVVAIERFYPDYGISVYGLQYNAQGDVFDKNNISHLFVQPLPSKQGSVNLYDLEKERKEFPDRVDTILQVLRSFEESMGFKSETQVFPTDQDGGVLFKVPEEWTTSTYMISLYSLIIRAAAYLKLNDPIGAFLGVPQLDNSMVANVRPKIDYMLKTKRLPIQRMEDFMSKLTKTFSASLHNEGIMAWQFSSEPSSLYLGKNPVTDEVILKGG